jgi:PAS domain S-box-containing protein
LSISGPGADTRASQIDALAVVHKLASSPTTAADAIAVLHELQVHQVELELQQEELRRSQIELESALRRQIALVERAPVGYMTIDVNTVLREINPAGARLLGEAREDLLGKPLAAFLADNSIDALQTLLHRSRKGRVPESCELQLRPIAGLNRAVRAAAEQDTEPGHYLLVLMSPAQGGS